MDGAQTVCAMPTGVTLSYGHGYLRELLADAVLHNAPKIEVVVWLIWDASPSLPHWLQVKRLWRLRVGRKRQFIKLEMEKLKKKKMKKSLRV